MRIHRFIVLTFFSFCGCICFSQESEEDGAQSFTLAAAAAAKESRSRSIVGIDESWLFLKSEMSHVGKGAFWEKNWSEVSVSGEDPVPVFLSLNEKLKSLGVQFIFVPVPPKVSIYPDKFTEKVIMDKEFPANNAVTVLAPFLDKLRDGGIKVIDLEPLLREDRRSHSPRSYCKTDSHPSPWTCQLIASLVAKEFHNEEWVKRVAEGSGLNFVKSDPMKKEIKGDLIPEGQRDDWVAESITVVEAGILKGKEIQSVPPDDLRSPVILLGDSHTLIFHEGDDMLMSKAGVVDHLQELLGFRVFLAASRGSSSQALRQIYRGPEFWKGKKILVWVSSAREFTQERRWLKLPRLPR